MRSSASIAPKLSYGSGSGTGEPLARARSGEEPTTPRTWTPMRRSASTCTTPIKPVPTTAARRSVTSRIACRSYEVARLGSDVGCADECGADTHGRRTRAQECRRVRRVDPASGEERHIVEGPAEVSHELRS